MKIPIDDIEALCAYVGLDIVNGRQMCASDWIETIGRVKAWLDSDAEQAVGPAGADHSEDDSDKPAVSNSNQDAVR